MRRCGLFLWAICALAAESGLHPGRTADLFEEVRRVPWLGSADGGSASRYRHQVAESIAPGNASNSTLIQRVTSTKPGFKMPPAGRALSRREIATIRTWIDAGAKAPVEKAALRRDPRTGRSSRLKRPAVPTVQKQAGCGIRSMRSFWRGWKAEKIEPSPEASKATLLRRASLDLTGLPPTPG